MIAFGASAVALTHADHVSDAPAGPVAARPRSGMVTPVLPVSLRPGPMKEPSVVDAGVLRVVAVARGILRRLRRLGEVIDEHRVAVVGRLRIGAAGHRLAAGIAVVEPERGRGAGLQVGNLHPDERLAQERVVFFDVEGERRLVVACHDADVAAVIPRGGELKVAIMQPDQHRARADGVGDGHGRAAGVDRDLFTQGPIGVPPSLCRRRTAAGPQQEDEEEKFSREKLCFMIKIPPRGGRSAAPRKRWVCDLVKSGNPKSNEPLRMIDQALDPRARRRRWPA